MRRKRVRKKEDKYISTREAAKMLGIAMSTVYRYFDWGILTGEQHPLTHVRKIDKSRVLGLMKQYGMKWQEPT
jgi:transposase